MDRNLLSEWRFDALLSELADIFSREGRDGGRQAARGLRNAIGGEYRTRLSNAAPVELLHAASNLPDAVFPADLVARCANDLDWEGEGLDQAISARLFTTELVGPDGHVWQPDIRVGLLISDCNTDYPVSSHAGEETYYVLAGTAEWTLDRNPYRRRPPGSFVHHPAWVEHGRRTLAEPFLGVWRWSGDLDLSSFSVSQA